MKTDSLRKVWPHGPELCREVAKECDSCIIAFSCGKDAYAATRAALDSGAFRRVELCYLWLIPGLSFVDDGIRYFEDHFQRKIHRMPHPSFYRWMLHGMHQTPATAKWLDKVGAPDIDYEDVWTAFREEVGLPENSFHASGVRAADSIMRRLSIKQHGPILANKKKFLPVWDWSKRDVMDCMAKHGARLPVDYEMFGRSFDGVDYRFIKPIMDRFPADFQRIKDFFPLIEAEVFRYERL